MTIKEIGTALYFCEGTKERLSTTNAKVRRIEFCNSNSKIIRYFMKYLRSFGIEEKKLRARLHLHKGDSELDVMEYWSALVEIPHNQFIKTSWKKKASCRKRKVPYGLLSIRYGDAELFKRIMKDIDEVFL